MNMKRLKKLKLKIKLQTCKATSLFQVVTCSNRQEMGDHIITKSEGDGDGVTWLYTCDGKFICK
jgi:hypothetical protein